MKKKVFFIKQQTLQKIQLRKLKTEGQDINFYYYKIKKDSSDVPQQTMKLWEWQRAFPLLRQTFRAFAGIVGVVADDREGGKEPTSAQGFFFIFCCGGERGRKIGATVSLNVPLFLLFRYPELKSLEELGFVFSFLTLFAINESAYMESINILACIHEIVQAYLYLNKTKIIRARERVTLIIIYNLKFYFQRPIFSLRIIKEILFQNLTFRLH